MNFKKEIIVEKNFKNILKNNEKFENGMLSEQGLANIKYFTTLFLNELFPYTFFIETLENMTLERKTQYDDYDTDRFFSFDATNVQDDKTFLEKYFQKSQKCFRTLVPKVLRKKTKENIKKCTKGIFGNLKESLESYQDACQKLTELDKKWENSSVSNPKTLCQYQKSYLYAYTIFPKLNYLNPNIKISETLLLKSLFPDVKNLEDDVSNIKPTVVDPPKITHTFKEDFKLKLDNIANAMQEINGENGENVMGIGGTVFPKYYKFLSIELQPFLEKVGLNTIFIKDPEGIEQFHQKVKDNFNISVALKKYEDENNRLSDEYPVLLNVANLMQNIYENNPDDNEVKSVVGKLFDRLQEQNKNCGTGLKGRLLIVYHGACLHLLDNVDVFLNKLKKEDSSSDESEDESIKEENERKLLEKKLLDEKNLKRKEEEKKLKEKILEYTKMTEEEEKRLLEKKILDEKKLKEVIKKEEKIYSFNDFLSKLDGKGFTKWFATEDGSNKSKIIEVKKWLRIANPDISWNTMQKNNFINFKKTVEEELKKIV